jgi:hypothetical protein
VEKSLDKVTQTPIISPTHPKADFLGPILGCEPLVINLAHNFRAQLLMHHLQKAVLVGGAHYVIE